MAHVITNRKSGFIVRGGRSIRQMLWLQGTEVSSNLAAASSAVLQTVLNAAALALRPFTIVRTRGLLMARSDQDAVDETWSVAYGEIVVTDQAAAIGITAVPTPDADNASDWFVYERVSNRISVTTDVGRLLTGVERIVDSKAMRKVDLGETLISVSEASAQSLGVDINIFSRTLLKLH